MPVLQFHLVAINHQADAVASLLEASSQFYAAALYPEMERPPVERIRAFVTDVAPEHWATGGKLVCNGAPLAPYFTCIAMKGRPAEQLQKLMRGLCELTAHHLDCPLDMIRGQLIEIEATNWYIGGSPASSARSDEIALRKNFTE